jgi:photosynthetic reaction center cytochrome c subunit
MEIFQMAKSIPMLFAMAALGLAQHDGPAAPPASKTAEQVFKNVIALKGIPADQLIPAMQFISAALGGDCGMCHVPEHPDLDDKPAKKTARAMIAMTLEINKNSFNGRTQVTCFTCHEGGEHPSSVPPVMESDMAPHAETNSAATTPTADDIIAKYISAAGGADAIKKINSRVMTGKILAGGGSTPIQLFTRAPNMRVSISHNANGDSFTAFDGAAGWMGSTGRPARDMAPADSESAGLDAEFYLPLRIKEIFTQVRRGRPEEIAGAMCEVLNGTRQGRPPVRLYFDQKTGLLMRMVRYTDTPVGRNPVQIDYADYREADGVKIPFRWTLARTNGRFTIQIEDVKSNVPIDDAKFAKPGGVVK